MSSQVNTKELMVQNQKKVMELMEKSKAQIKNAIPPSVASHFTPDRLIRIVLTEMRKNQKLCQCAPLSIVASVMLSAQLGVEIGVLGEAYLVPYNNRKTGEVECQFILGYKGMISLARRSGQIISIAAHCVYENDEFTYEYGLNETLKHAPSLTERGKFKAVYAVAKLVGGGHQFEVMSQADVNAIKQKSKAKDSGPWVTDFDEMARKTAIRKLFKYLPASVEMNRAVAIEESIESDQNVIELASESYDVVDNFFTEESTATATAKTVKTQADEMADLI